MTSTYDYAINTQLDAIASTVESPDSAEEALSRAMLAVCDMNLWLADQMGNQAARVPVSATIADSILERLKKWIQKLREAFMKIIEYLTDIVSFSISFGGSPPGVSVGVTFAAPGAS